MAITLQSFGSLVSNAGAAAQGACTQLIDLTVGSVTRAIIEAHAAVALWLQFVALIILGRTRLSTSQGIDVDSWVADFALTRLPATYATGTVTLISLNPTSQAATVPLGATVRTSAGISYAVILDTTNAAYSPTAAGYVRPIGTKSIDVPIQAVAAGSSGNVGAGVINLLGTAISGIDTCNNALAITDASDGETDAALRARFVTFINSRSQATRLAVVNAILSVQTGLLYQIAENVDAAGNADPGNFVVYIDDGSGNPPATLITAVYAAVDAVRAIGSSFQVLPPTVLTANVNTTVAVTPGYVATTVQAAVNTAITAYIDSLTIGGNMSYTRLTYLAYNVAGVYNVVNTTLNSGTADLFTTQGVAIRAGTITVQTV